MMTVAAAGSPIGNPARIWGFKEPHKAQVLCGALDEECFQQSDFLRVLSYFNHCAEVDEAPCISAVSFRVGEAWNAAQFIRSVDFNPSPEHVQWATRTLTSDPNCTINCEIVAAGLGSSWKPNSQYKLPGSASGPLLFKLPGLMNAADTDTYVLNSRYEYRLDISGGVPGKIHESKVDINFRPYIETVSPGTKAPVEFLRKDKFGEFGFGGMGTGADMEVAWVENDKKAFAAKFNSSPPIRIEMKLPSMVKGWFHGRLGNSTIDVKKIDASTNQVTVTGEPIKVPVTTAWVDMFDPKNEDLLESRKSDPYIAEARKRDQSGIAGLTGSFWSPGDPLDRYQMWESRMGDKAKGEFEVWYFGTLPHWETSRSSCLAKTDTLQGMITTNSMAYQAGLPSFSGGFLNYQVAGLHYAQDGQVFSGTYELIMRSEAARCLYGFSKAPVSGTLSVVSDDGQQKVSTTTVGESGGWLKLSANNFSFSNNTIKVKLTQKMRSVTCVSISNKKLTKIVRAVQPTCPKGYKKKQ